MMTFVAIRLTCLFLLLPFFNAAFQGYGAETDNDDFHFDNHEYIEGSGYADEDDDFGNDDSDPDAFPNPDEFPNYDTSYPEYTFPSEEVTGTEDEEDFEGTDKVETFDGNGLDKGLDDGTGIQQPRNTDNDQMTAVNYNPTGSIPENIYTWRVKYVKEVREGEDVRDIVKNLLNTQFDYYLQGQNTRIEVPFAVYDPASRSYNVDLKFASSANEEDFKGAIYYMSQGELNSYGLQSDFNQVVTEGVTSETERSASSCSPNEFFCSDQCIDVRMKCDGKYDCRDGTDEMNCDPNRPPVSSCSPNTEFECSPGNCISKTQVCDGSVDCPGGANSDEDNCFVSVGPSRLVLRVRGGAEFTCSSPKGKAVVWKSQRTQNLPPNFRDEGNGNLIIRDVKESDAGEYVCSIADDRTGRYQATANLLVEKIVRPTDQRPPNSGQSGYCSRDQFQCNNGKCIPKDYVCDADYDCEDQSDEKECAVKSQCEPNEFRCRSNKCILVLWKCDGDKDCGRADNSDEEGCDISLTQAGCRKDEFACHTQNQCIPLGYHCDNQTDCMDRSDEHGCTPPTVPKPMKRKITGKRGHNLTLTCETQGVPAPIIVWRLNWGHVGPYPRVVSELERLTPYSKYHQLVTTSSVLTINSLKQEDEGAYSCEAINSLGSTFATPDTIVIVIGDDKVCRPGTYNSAAVSPSECMPCWCSGVTDQCFSADNLYYYQKTYNNNIGLLKPTSTLQQRNRKNIRFISVPSFHGNKLSIYGGTIEYNFFYNVTTTPTPYPGPYIAAYIESPSGKLLYFLDRLPERGITHFYTLPFEEKNWYKDETKTIPASRSDFMQAISELESLTIATQFVDTVDTSGITNLKISESSRSDMGIKAYFVEECQCPIGYTGNSCEKCAELYQKDRATNKCMSICDCSGHSTECTGYDEFITCVNCQHNTIGPKCEMCLPGFYGNAQKGTPYDCKRCDCAPNLDGSPGTCWEKFGEIQCDRCPTGSYGLDCRKCHRGYIPDSKFGCILKRGSDCHMEGTERINPDESCYCKPNVQGVSCDKCTDDHFYGDLESVDSCKPCQCFGAGIGCKEANDLYPKHIQLDIERQPANFDGLEVLGVQGELEPYIIQPYYPVEYQGCVAFRDSTKAVQYWVLPEKFVKDPLYTYDGKLTYDLFFNSNIPNYKNDAPEVILTTSDRQLIYQVEKTEHQPSTEIIINEDKWIDDRGSKLSRMDFLKFLRNLQSIKIKAKFTYADIENRICNVKQIRASSDRVQAHPIKGLQICKCKPGHEGYFCEKCSQGYEAVFQGDASTCIRKESSGNCQDGLYFDPRYNDCKECKCPQSNRHNGNVLKCNWKNGDYFCTECPTGHDGLHCDQCITDYIGYPTEPYGTCQFIDIDIEDPIELQPAPDQKEKTEAEINSDVTLRCNLVGTRPVAIRWSRSNGSPLPTNSFVNVDDDYSLTIRRIQRQDEGVYVCQAMNSEGEIKINIDLYIMLDDRPQLEIEASTPSPKSGEFYNLRCFTRNVVENAQITWSRSDGRPLTGVSHPGGSLVFNQLSANDRGQYVCQLRSPQGDASETHEINFSEIVIEKANEGSTVLIQCRASGSDLNRNSDLYWMRDGRRIDNRAQNIEIYDYFLKIKDVTKTDEGVYTCVIRVDDRSMESEVQLIVETQNTHDHPTIVGQRVALTCVLRPDQNPMSVYWLKDGSRYLGPQTTVTNDKTLVIEQSRYDDSGIYACIVKTSEDREEHQVKYHLIVRSDPRPSIQGPDRVTTRLDERLTLNCLVTGETPLQVKWQRNQREIRDPTYYYDPSSYSLTIYGVRPQDAGVWTCFAENQHGNFAYHVNVDIGNQPPVTGKTTYIQIQPATQTELWCNLGDDQSTTAQWTKNEASLPQHIRLSRDRNKLIIDRTSASDVGTYTCSFAEDGVSYSQTFVLTYTDQKPSITGGNVDNRVPVYSDITFPCVVSNSEDYQVSWSKDGNPIYENAAMVKGRDNSLILKMVKLADSGSYTCTAKNQYGSVDYTVHLTVKPVEDIPSNPGSYIFEPRTVYARIGEEAEFICVPTGGIEAIGSDWGRADGKPFDQRYNYASPGDQSILTIRNIQSNDAGTIICTITDDEFNDHMSYAELVVEDGSPVEKSPSAMIRTPYDINVKEGESVYVECEVQGSSPLDVYWTLNNQVHARHVNGDVLNITRVSDYDEGEYICYAKNPLGTAAARFYLNVQERDLGVELNPVVDVKEFEPFRLSCYAGSQQPVDSIEWSRHDGPLPPDVSQIKDANGHSMYIPKCQKENQGRYICTVYFVNGQKEVLYYTLRLPGYDYVPEGLIPVITDFGTRTTLHNDRISINPYETTLTKDSSAMLSCNFVSNNPFRPTYTWYHDGRPVNHPQTSADENYLTLRNVVLSQSGVYTCVVNTPLGNIYEQATVTVKEPDYVGGLLIEPRDTITLRAGDSLKIICTLPSDPRAYIVWQTPYGETFQEVTTATVDVDRVDESHQGTYTCSADNQLTGKVEVIVEGSSGGGSSGLHVYPAVNTASKGSNVELNCYGAPENTRIEWLKFQGGEEPRTSDEWYPINENNVVTRGAILSVSNAESFNAGVYKCVAYTREGVKEAVGKLDFMNAPVLSISPSVARVTPGSRLELRCDSGLENTLYEWKRQYGTPISPYSVSQYGVLTIESVQESDAGKYTCSAVNDVGYAETTVDVIFTSQPNMMITPENAKVEVGGELELACITGSSQNVNVVWKKQGGDLPKSHQAYSYFLTLYDMQEHDTGVYECFFSNQDGSHNAYTRVDVSRSFVDKETNTETARIGDEIKIACQVYTHPDNRNAKIQWLKDQQTLPPHHQVHDSFLIISNAQEIDQGVYKCSLTNHITGEMESAEVRLDILVPPVIPVMSAQRKVSVGSQTSLSCLAHGNPPPTITWFKDGRPLNSEKGVLIVEVRTSHDFGEYVCKASNQYGDVESIFKLEEGDMVPYFTQDVPSYISLHSLGKVNSLETVETSFRTLSQDGLVMFIGDNTEDSMPSLSLGLVRGQLHLRLDTGEQNLNIEGPQIAIGEWYTVKLSLEGQGQFSDNYKLIMEVGRERVELAWSGRALKLQSYIYFGGLPDLQRFAHKTMQSSGFTGCVSSLLLNGEKVNIGSDIFEVVKVKECPVCNNKPCQNGGSCSPTNSPEGFECKCMKGYSGSNCEITDNNGDTAFGHMTYHNRFPSLYNPHSDPNNLPPRYDTNYGNSHSSYPVETPLGEFGKKCHVQCLNGGECFYSYWGQAMCDCPIGFYGDKCKSYQKLERSVEMNRDGHLQVARDIIFPSTSLEHVIFEFKARISNPDVLLFWQAEDFMGNGDFFAISVNSTGYLTIRLRSQAQEEVIITNHLLTVGKDHSIFLEIGHTHLKVIMDQREHVHKFSRPIFSLKLHTNLFIGGADNIEYATGKRFTHHNEYVGCLWDLSNPYKSREPFNLHSIAMDGKNARSCN